MPTSFLRRTAAAALFIFGAAPVLATQLPTASMLINCQMKPGDKGGDWIAPAYAFTMHRNGNVFVVDSVGMRFAGRATPVEVTRKKKKAKLRWTLPLELEVNPNGAVMTDSMVSLHYVASLNTQTGKITIRAGTLRGSETTYRGSGVCDFHKA
ncbi:hypothetical protein [Shimia sp. R9_3]|uniref:hypothetical protein n=1 Tax=Shimia sp. R9_3 TaxID=2821113 RepID=UPI001ADA1627|nr:hypothetical protein [Shimia sp. R9_3]MBO9400869.1 hypothetical protein [Shimia sp. R9_3]